MKILLVEDDEQIAANLKIVLTREGYAARCEVSIEDALSCVMGEEYDLVICDRRLGDGDGVEIVKAMRSAGMATPTLILTARSGLSDIVEGLDSGADDYLTKPFDHKVLLARVRALLRRQDQIVLEPIVKIGEVEIDTNKREVKRRNKLVPLSPKEYALLEYLLLKQGKVVERVEILTHVWNEEVDLFSNTVDVHVRYLRQKLGKGIIVTIRGKGYRLCTPN